jgi:hypothetical protein
MDIGTLLRRSWEIVWDHKFLIILGILVALGSDGGINVNREGGGLHLDRPEQGFLPTPPTGGAWSDMLDLGQLRLPASNISLVLILGGLALLLGLAIWGVSTIARGGLIAGVSAIDAGNTSSFRTAWQAGWQTGWKLLGISVLPAIPALFLALVGLFSFVTYSGAASVFGPETGTRSFIGLGGLLTSLTCLALPVMMVLGLLQSFANRACMLENYSVFAAYKRGLNVLLENIGEALLLFIIQVVLNIGIGLVMIVPGLMMALCFVLWPLLIAIQGAIAAYFSTLWTLAWRAWTGEALSAAEVN